MRQIRYLLDENLVVYLADAIFQREPAIDILIPGEAIRPPKGTLDPDLLLAEKENLTLSTNDKRTMRTHIANHQRAGHNTWGVFFIREGFSTISHVENLILIWPTTEPEEWLNRLEWLPWGERAS